MRQMQPSQMVKLFLGEQARLSVGAVIPVVPHQAVVVAAAAPFQALVQAIHHRQERAMPIPVHLPTVVEINNRRQSSLFRLLQHALLLELLPLVSILVLLDQMYHLVSMRMEIRLLLVKLLDQMVPVQREEILKAV